MLEWKPRLVYLVLALAVLATLVLGYSLEAANYGW
jgi:hypothetical protein